MNCKQGDLAFTRAAACGVVAPQHFTGRMVEVVQYAGCLDAAETILPGHWWFVRPLGWVSPDNDVRADGCFKFPDALLRPIRGDDGAQAEAVECEREAA